MDDQVKSLYLEGYAAFDRGAFADAIFTATHCLAMATPGTYWYSGALGLRCWAASYSGDQAAVVRDARLLLTLDSGEDKAWFEGLALFNLGLAARQQGKAEEARQHFARASQRYAAYADQIEQPAAWQMIARFFAAATHWAASGETDGLRELAQRVASLPDPDPEIDHLATAIRLHLDQSAGRDVQAEASAAAAEGVSRAFLALLLCC